MLRALWTNVKERMSDRIAGAQMRIDWQQWMKKYWSTGLLVLMAGCCRVPESYRPVAEFQRKHPEEFGKFAYLNPISLNTYRAVWGMKAGEASYLLDETERRFGNIDGVKEFVNRMAKREGDDRQRIVEFFRELEAASSGGGAVCQYEWSDSKTRETGFLVLKSGEIIKREPWVTDYLVHDKE